MLNKFSSDKKAVSEVLGTILVLLISVSLFSVVYASLFSIDADKETPSVSIVGGIEDNNLILYHMGGRSLELDTEVVMGINNNSETISINVNDYLNDTYKINNNWDIGEKLIVNLTDFTNFQRFASLDLTVVDQESRSAVMLGEVQEDRYADISLSMHVDNINPMWGYEITITVNATNLGPSESEEIKITVDLPDGILYESHAGQGDFDESTEEWIISNINESQMVSLVIKAIVLPPKDKYTRLCFILDGSDAVPPADFTMIKNSIAQAIINQDIPNRRMVQISIIEYGETGNVSSPHAKLMVNSLITPLNYFNVANSIIAIPKFGDSARPLAHAINLASSVLGISSHTDAYYAYNQQMYGKKVVNLVIGADPNIGFPYQSESAPNVLEGWASAIKQRDLMLEKFRYDIEFDAEVVDWTSSTLDINKLKNKIVYPEPGTYYPTGVKPTSPGWVKDIQNQADFQDALESLVLIAFNGGTITVKLESTTYDDPNPDNDVVTVTISPKI